MNSASCPFCERATQGGTLAQNELAFAIPDKFPLSPGHALILPRRHEPDFLALTPDERSAMWQLLPEVLERVGREHSPDGYNIGVNVGEAAGQTVAHAHIHVIPRYKGDVEDPRGGIRWIIPHKAPYWRD